MWCHFLRHKKHPPLKQLHIPPYHPNFAKQYQPKNGTSGYPHWLQRLSNYKKALSQLEKAVALSHERALSNLEEQGLIQSFEYTQELAWNVMKDFLEYQGNTAITGSRDAIREAFSAGLVTDGDGWLNTIKSRNKSTQTYNQETADEITSLVVNLYIDLFRAFVIKMEALRPQMSAI